MTTENRNFKLIRIEYGDEDPQYPEFAVSSRAIGNFSSLVDAELAMKNEIETGNVNIFGFLIEMYIIDKKTIKPVKMQNYLSDGTFWDETIVYDEIDNFDELYENIGRPIDKIRFKKGDLVEVLNLDTVTLEILELVPPTHEELKRGARFPIHYTDNCYSTIDKNFKVNTNKTGDRLFPIRLNVCNKLEKNLKEFYNVSAS